MSVHRVPFEISIADWDIVDPGDAAALPINQSGSLGITTVGVETNTMPAPQRIGIRIMIYCEAYASTRTITVDTGTGFDIAGNEVLTFTAAGQWCVLESIKNSATNFVWRVVAWEGVTGPLLAVTASNLVVSNTLTVTGRQFYDAPAPQTATNTASLTDAQILGGVIVATPTSAATYTMRTGAQIDAALFAADGVNPTVNSAFDLTIINLGSATDIITMAVASGVTFVGSLTIDDPGADINSSGTYRIRKTGTSAFVCYRIA